MKSQGKWHRGITEYALKIGLVILAACWLVVMAMSWADASTDVSNDARDRRDEDSEYNFNWLDPEKKIYVLQNRRYLKENRPYFSIGVGPAFSNAYRDSYALDARIAYYMSETFGLEVFYAGIINKENNHFTALKEATNNVIPVIREIRSQYGALVHYVPWYAKINVFNKILYFDWYFSGGLGSIHSARDDRKNATKPALFVNEDLFAFFLGTGHQYHLSQSFSVRLDITGAFYQAPIFQTPGSGENVWFSNYLVTIGFGLRP